MVPDVSTGSSTLGLINYLFGEGRRDEHTDPHIVAAWDMAGAPDPGRDPGATYAKLAQRLDHHVVLRTRELGGARPPQHVWHCPVRTAPGDRYLTDAEWAEVARRVVAAAGIAPEDDEKACRWIAVRHADDHIHILATTVRADGRRPRTHRDGQRAQRECRRIEAEFGLRRLKSGDLTAPRTPTGAERAKAGRQGQAVTAREWLRERAYTVAAGVRSVDEYFTVLRSLGVQVRTRIGPETGEVTGYSLAAPGDTNGQGEPIWYGGSKLAPDLSLNRLRERLPDQETAGRPQHIAEPGGPWRRAETALREARVSVESGEDHVAQAQLDAFGDTLHSLALATDGAHQADLHEAAKAFNRARRSVIRSDHQAATALRKAAKELAYASRDPGGLAIALIFAAVHMARAASAWHRQRGHEQQAAADSAWAALTTALARAETAGHDVRELLSEAAAERELDTADSPAHVLIWRIVSQPNKRTEAARRRRAMAPRTVLSRPTAAHEHSGPHRPADAHDGPRLGRRGQAA